MNQLRGRPCITKQLQSKHIILRYLTYLEMIEGFFYLGKTCKQKKVNHFFGIFILKRQQISKKTNKMILSILFYRVWRFYVLQSGKKTRLRTNLALREKISWKFATNGERWWWWFLTRSEGKKNTCISILM